jgi:hypothetical protein
MPGVIADLPNWAESLFATLCAEHALTCNKAQQDRFGWDYIVELDRERLPERPYDEQQGSATGRVQVKSKTGGKPSALLKLSNALRFVKEANPCFVLLVWRPKDGTGVQLFARHFHKDLMAAALKRAREADRDAEEALHKVRLAIPFRAEDDHTEDLIPWMKSILLDSGDRYSAEKLGLDKTLGYEAPTVSGTISFKASELQSFVDHSVGLKDEVAVDRVEIRTHRFDIAARTPVFSGKPDKVMMRVKPTPAIMTVQSANGRRVELNGDFRAFYFPGLGPDLFKASFICSFLVAAIHADGRMEISYRYDSSQRLPLADLAKVVAFHLASRGPLSIALSVSGKQTLTSTPLSLPTESDAWFDWFETALRTLESMLPARSAAKMSLDDLALAEEEVTRFVQLLHDGDMTVSINTDATDLPPARHLIGFAYVTVAQTTFMTLFRRPCLGQEKRGDLLWLRFGDPVRVDTRVCAGASKRHLPRLRERFERILAAAGGGAVVIHGGDLMAAGESGDVYLIP